MTNGDQSVPMFHGEVTPQIDRAMGSIGHPCSSIQGSARYLVLMRPDPFSITSLDQANNPCSSLLFKHWGGICLWWDKALILLLHLTKPTTHAVVLFKLRWGICLWWDQAILQSPCWTSGHYPRPELNMVINPYKSTLFPTASLDKAFFVFDMQFSIGKMIKRRQNTITVYRMEEPVIIFVTSGRNCAALI